MNRITRVCLIVSSVAVAAPAAAQEPSWVRDLEARVEAALEAVAGAVDDQLGRPPRAARQNRRDAQRGSEFTEPFSRTVRLGRNGTLELSNVAGDVTITGGGGNDLRINATKRVRERSEADARARLKEIEIQVSDRGGVVEVRTEFPRRGNLSAAVDYAIGVPSGATVAVKSVSGNLRVTNVRGEVRAESVNGNVVTSSVGRLRSVRSVSGDVHITDAESDDLSGNTISGNIVVRKIKARGIDLQSISGSVRLAEADSERLNVKTNSGAVEYAGRLTRSGRYQLQSFSGTITVVPAGNPGFDIEATTFSGDVRSDYGLTVRGAGNNLIGRGPGRSLRASFGDASAILSLRSFSGDILILKRD